MTKNPRTAALIKGQISKFSGIISRELPKPKQKLVREMIYGIQAVKDLKLSNITRSLNELIPLIKTEDRLWRNLDDRDFTDEINNQICRLASRKVLDDMVIAIDPLVQLTTSDSLLFKVSGLPVKVASGIAF